VTIALTTYLFRLQFQSPLHLGEPGIGLEAAGEHCPSDTLFGAIINAWALIFGKEWVRDLLQQFLDGQPPFRLSSAFPYWQWEEQEYKREECSLPRPWMSPYHRNIPDEDRRPIQREVRFVPAGLFRKWVRQDGLSEAEASRINELPNKKPWGDYQRPHIRWDRGGARTQLFSVGVLEFKENAGLYFLLRTGLPEMVQNVAKALKLLGEELGLGGERGAGCGRFVFDCPELPDDLKDAIRDSDVPARWCVLSIFHPRPEERRRLEGYRLVERGGYADSPFARKQVERKRCYLLAEGAVVSAADPVSGAMMDVTPDESFRKEVHPVYRYALAFPVGIAV
jgi:CRISPR-associated protein Csm4